MNLLIIGPQASGKGTQAELIAKEKKIAHISTGDMFRAFAQQTTPLGKKIKSLIDAGQLVPDELTIKLLKRRLAKADCENGFILDGFPRSIHQAESLDKITKIDSVIVLNVPDKISIQRISSRWTCTKCSSIYGFANPPKKKGVCDKCSGKLFQRDDDSPETVKKRLETYHLQTEPLVGYYRKNGVLLMIDGTKTIPEVFASIKQILSRQ